MSKVGKFVCECGNLYNVVVDGETEHFFGRDMSVEVTVCRQDSCRKRLILTKGQKQSIGDPHKIMYIGNTGDQSTVFELWGLKFEPRVVQPVSETLYNVLKNHRRFISVEGNRTTIMDFPNASSFGTSNYEMSSLSSDVPTLWSGTEMVSSGSRLTR